ncbi:MAG: hypothetical protein ACLGG7_06930 [Bacteriovoracia bacterium]
MNPALLFSLWSVAASALLSGFWLSHRHYNDLMIKDIRAFEAAWKKMEKSRDQITF